MLGVRVGADGQIRTDDLSFTKALLYQLSYVGALARIVAPGDFRAAGGERRSIGAKTDGLAASERHDFVECRTVSITGIDDQNRELQPNRLKRPRFVLCLLDAR